MKKYYIQGNTIKDIPSLCNAFAKAVNTPSGSWGETYLSFDDRLFGGTGFEPPCEIVWIDSDKSKQHLSSRYLIEYFGTILNDSSHDHHDLFIDNDWILEAINKAKLNKISMFDIIIETIDSVEERYLKNWPIKLTLK